MVGEKTLVPQIEETKIFDFGRANIVVGFLCDICMDDLKILQTYYKIADKNFGMLRYQNQMRIRHNDKYQSILEQEIARLENRWVLPLLRVNNIFESATMYTDVPPKDIKPQSEKGGLEITDTKKTDIQSRSKWMDEPAVITLKALGVRPYKEAMTRLRRLRDRRNQYKYLELYFLNIAREAFNVQENLKLVQTIIEVVINTRNEFGEDSIQGNPIGKIIEDIVSSLTLKDAIEKLKKLNLKDILSKQGGAAGQKSTTSPADSATNTAGAREKLVPKTDKSTGLNKIVGGDMPTMAINPPMINPRGVNLRQNQRSPKSV